jgi:hypothetical protein
METRNCFAVCTGKASWKAWSRVMLKSKDGQEITRVSFDDVKAVHPSLLALAEASTAWTLEKAKDVWSGPLLEVRGRIRTTLLGIADPYLEPYFVRLAEPEVTAENILQDKELDERLTTYSRSVMDLQEPLSSYCLRTTKYCWCKIQMWALCTNGNLVPRPVLLFGRDLPDYTEMVGLTYDDSKNGDSMLRAGAKFGKIIGSWI